MFELQVIWIGPSGAATVRPTAKLVTQRDEHYLCDDWDELVMAMDQGERFLAHSVVAMKPNPLIVNPAHVVTIEKV